MPVLAANPGIQNTGAFQLDGDAQQATPALSAGDDWDNICASNPSTCTFQNSFSASPSTTAIASAHVSDSAISPECAGGTNCTVFTGGGSKDPSDLPSWNWKTDTGGLPSKDNLAHSFAARYALPSTGPTDPNCPAATSGSDTCKALYFGSDRIDNSGDAQEGFWFFQNSVSLNTDGTFNGVHSVGDLLILSDFSVGGTTSTINVYKWVASGGDVSAHLQSLGGSTGAACNRTPPPSTPDPFCGLVNPTNGTIAPWVFTDKSGNHTYLQGELYEGGINLSAPSLNLGGECFASFLSETRSSTSPTATLKDFVLGNFARCTSGITTTPEDASGTSIGSQGGTVSIGTGSVRVQDLAVVTGVGSTTKPTGTVTFFICGPAATIDAAQCDTSTPTPKFNGGTQTGAQLPGSPVTISPSNCPTGTTSNSSCASSGLVTLTEVASYCFRGDYSGDSLFPKASDNSQNECFSVTPVNASLVTNASCSASPCLLGATLSDTATLSGAANRPGTGGIGPDGSINPTAQALPGGTISFTAFGPDSCSITALATTTRSVTNGNGTYPQGGQPAVGFTPTAVGSYVFVATYGGDPPNTLAPTTTATCGSPGTNETILVTDTTSVLTDQVWLPNDQAQISSTGGSPLVGSVVFTLYNDATCGNNGGTAQYTSASIPVSGASPQYANSNNTTVKVDASSSSSWSWKVAYTSTANNVTGSTSSCESTTVNINNNPGYTPLHSPAP